MFTRLLVPIDDSDASLRGLRQAIDLADGHRAALAWVEPAAVKA